MEPLYVKLFTLLRDSLQHGEFPPGSKLPPERQLSEIYGVSRITVRRALDELERMGLLERRQGIGTVVATPRMRASLFDRFTYAESLRAAGYLVATHLVSKHIREAREHECEALELASGSFVVELVRRRDADGAPFALETGVLPIDRLPGVDTIDLGSASLYSALVEHCDVVPARAHEWFEPVLIARGDARLLATRPGTPALRLVRTTYSSTGAPVEYSTAVIGAERCRLLVELWLEWDIRNHEIVPSDNG